MLATTPGSGTLQMVINGNRTAGVVVWSQSVPVIQNANYEFNYWLQTVVNGVDPAPSKLQLYVNGVMAGPIYTANANSGNWTQYIYNTNAGSNNILNLELINQTTAANGNDFALDDLSFKQILSSTSTQNVTVSPSLVASVSVTHSPTAVYQNTPVIFTANPVNGGVTPTYKWFVGGVEQVGHTLSAFNYTPTSTGSLTVTCQMTSSITCASPKPAIGTDIISVQPPIQNYWMGYIDIDWGKPANWTAGYVPATGDNVIYATVANFGTAAIRDLQLDKNRTIGSLINATIRRLLVPAEKGLVVNNVIDIGIKTDEADRIYIYSSPTAANGSLIYHNAVDNPVSATVEMYSRAWWNLADTINNRYRWQYFGIPLRSVKAFPTFNGSFVRKWYETGTTIQNHWIQLQNDSTLHPFYGYEICQEVPKTIYFKGILENGNFNSGPLGYTYYGVNDTKNALYPGQYVFANPYTAAIDIRQLIFGTDMQASVYLYNTGSFSIWEANGEGNSTFSTNAEGQYLNIPQQFAGTGDFGLPRQVPSMGAMLVRNNIKQESGGGRWCLPPRSRQLTVLALVASSAR